MSLCRRVRQRDRFRSPSQHASASLGVPDLRQIVLGYTAPQNLAGLPACAVRAGFDAQGMPVGIQFTGREGADLQVLAVATALPPCHPRDSGEVAGVPEPTIATGSRRVGRTAWKKRYSRQDISSRMPGVSVTLFLLVGKCPLRRMDPSLVPATSSCRTRTTFENLRRVLREVGCDTGDLVRLSTYFVFDGPEADFADFWSRMNRVRSEYLSEPGPTATAVRVCGLARAGLLIRGRWNSGDRSSLIARRVAWRIGRPSVSN